MNHATIKRRLEDRREQSSVEKSIIQERRRAEESINNRQHPRLLHMLDHPARTSNADRRLTPRVPHERRSGLRAYVSPHGLHYRWYDTIYEGISSVL